MVVNPLKIFLFLMGVSAAGGATAFVSGALDPYLYGKGAGAASVAEQPQPAPSDPAAPKDERLPDAPAPGTMAATPPAEGTTPPPGTMAALPPADGATPPPATMAPTPPAGPQAPTFDILRVQEDGSVVVAGKALADSLVELLNGITVLGSSKATPEGDFVIVLDEPLKPGDYQLTLRATPPSGAAVASLQTAVLSVPDKPGGQVLAMVEEPGEPSQILTVPEPGKPGDVAAAPAETTPPASEQPKPGEAAAPPAGEKPADVASAPAETTPPTPPAGQAPEVAATPPADAGKPAETNPAPAAAKVAVEAVEIEGKRIFVAGVGEPGRGVRVYANETVLGESKVDPAGRFLVETERELAVGHYMIRADLLDADGSTVLARAVVPFEREEGEAIAAVAPPASNPPAADQPGDVAAAPSETPPPADTAPATPPAVASEQPPAAATPGEPPAVAAAEPEQPAAPADSAAPVQPKPDEAAAPPPATAEQPGTDVAAATPPETTAPKLVTVHGSVIIRRGDTLWRISKRVYGRGTRYSTIYLANQPQIADPDRIWPGQVFQVPDKSKEGEPADMKAMGDQMVPPPAAQSAGTAQ